MSDLTECRSANCVARRVLALHFHVASFSTTPIVKQMTLSDFNDRAALFCTAKEKPSAAWLSQACERAFTEGDEALELVDEDEVNTTGWSIQQVAEWAAEKLRDDKDDRACRSFVIADDKSESTDSLVIVTLHNSTFGMADSDDRSEIWVQRMKLQEFQRVEENGMSAKGLEKTEMQSKVEDQASPLDKDLKPKVIIKRAFRASPELCSILPSLIHSDDRSCWRYECEGDDPFGIDEIYKWQPPSAEEQAKKEQEPNDLVYGSLHDQSGKEYHGFVAVSRTFKQYQTPSLENMGVIEDIPVYRLANGMFLCTSKDFEKDALDKQPLPKVNLREKGGEVAVIGRYDPNCSLESKM